MKQEQIDALVSYRMERSRESIEAARLMLTKGMCNRCYEPRILWHDLCRAGSYFTLRCYILKTRPG